MFLPSREVEKVSTGRDLGRDPLDTGEAKAKGAITTPSAPSLPLPPTFPASASSPRFPQHFFDILTSPLFQSQSRSLKAKALGDCPLWMSRPHLPCPLLQSTVYVTPYGLLTPGLCTCYSYCLGLPFPAVFPSSRVCVMLPLSLDLKDSFVFPTHLNVLSRSAEFTSLPEVLWGVKLGGFYFFIGFLHQPPGHYLTLS